MDGDRRRVGMRILLSSVSSEELAGPLSFLEGAIREGETLPSSFVEALRGSVERGDVEVISALSNGRVCGVAVVAYRPAISLGGRFASIEDLHVSPDARRQGIGRMLLEEVARRCSEKNISYVEVQTNREAEPFYRELGFEPEEEMRVLAKSLPLGPS